MVQRLGVFFRGRGGLITREIFKAARLFGIFFRCVPAAAHASCDRPNLRRDPRKENLFLRNEGF